MGAPFLDEALRFPTFKSRFFDITQVARFEAVQKAFTRALNLARQEAKAKDETSRPHIIIGGGDGTASFGLWVIFRALHHEGVCLWSDEDMQQYFPALVQMPLGTGNDLAGVLGWGRTINPLSDPSGARAWVQDAVSSRRQVEPFDVWGIYPSENAKLCMYSGPGGRADRQRFEEAGPAVPFLCLLYFSFGFEAMVAAIVEHHRTDSRMKNFLEYGKAVPAGMLGMQRENCSLQGIQVYSGNTGDECEQLERFFPPRDSTGWEYLNVGFMNIDSFGGGTWSASDPARFDDGTLDLFRQRDLAANFMKRGRHFNTEKKQFARFTVPAHHMGAHIQWDGEARFLFSPSREQINIDVTRVMQVPVVIGPHASSTPTTPQAGDWTRVLGSDLAGEDAAFLPARDLEDCKEVCVKYGFGGFSVHDGHAHFRAETGSAVKLVEKEGCVAYIYHERAQGQSFRFMPGSGVATQLDAWLRGMLMDRMKASQEEVVALQSWTDEWAQGTCARSKRGHVDFGPTLRRSKCTLCEGRTMNWRCKGCCKPFCRSCFTEHQGTAPNAKWMYNDLGKYSSQNPLRWSGMLCLDDIIDQLEALMRPNKRKQSMVQTFSSGASCERPIAVVVVKGGTSEAEELTFEDPMTAVNWLREYRARDLREAREENLAGTHGTFICD